VSDAPRNRAGRLGLIIPIAVFVAFAAGWTIYWHVLKHEATRRIEALLASQQAAGAEASAKIVRGWGFPRELTFELKDVAYAPRDRDWRAATATLRLNVNPVNPAHVLIEAPAPIDIAWRSGRSARLSGRDLRASVRLRRGTLAQAGVEGRDIVYADANPNGRSFSAAQAGAHARPDSRTPGSYQVSIEVQSLELARPVRVFERFGQRLDRAQGYIVVDKGDALFAERPRDPFESWRNAGGAARVESARVQWGPAVIVSKGRATLDAQRRLAGRLDVTFEKPAAAIRALGQSPALPADTRRSLEMFAVGVALSGENLDTNVEARDGWLSLGGIRVRTLAPLY
jgi:hypothetical protein